jgi:hypothetical protein
MTHERKTPRNSALAFLVQKAAGRTSDLEHLELIRKQTGKGIAE